MPKFAAYVQSFREIVIDPLIKSEISNGLGEIRNPKSKSADVVLKIVKLLADAGYKVTNSTIYTRIRQAKNINTLLGIVESTNEKLNTQSSEEFEEENEVNVSKVEKEYITKVLLVDDQLDAIYPVSRVVDGRTRTYPKDGWTDTVQNVLSDALKLPCAFRYKFISISKVFCSAECSECKVKVHVYLDKKILAVKLINAPDESITHKKSRQLRGKLRNINVKDSAFNHYNRNKLENANNNGKIVQKN
jgi:hypothetical protein